MRVDEKSIYIIQCILPHRSCMDVRHHRQYQGFHDITILAGKKTPFRFDCVVFDLRVQPETYKHTKHYLPKKHTKKYRAREIERGKEQPATVRFVRPDSNVLHGIHIFMLRIGT